MIEIKANPECKWCHGEGVVYDSVPYGDTTAQFPTTCEACIEWNIEQGLIDEEDIDDVELWPSEDPRYDECEARPGGVDWF